MKVIAAQKMVALEFTFFLQSITYPSGFKNIRRQKSYLISSSDNEGMSELRTGSLPGRTNMIYNRKVTNTRTKFLQAKSSSQAYPPVTYSCRTSANVGLRRTFSIERAGNEILRTFSLHDLVILLNCFVDFIVFRQL